MPTLLKSADIPSISSPADPRGDIGIPDVATPPIVPDDLGNAWQNIRLQEIFGPTESAEAEFGSYNPETPALDAYRELASSYPEDEGRGFMSKLALSMMALENPGLVMQEMNRPSQDVQDWRLQLGPAEAAMRAEQTMLGRGLEAERIGVSKDRLALDQLKAQFPNLDIVKVEGGNYQAFDPSTGKMHDLGISTGTLTPQDEAELKIETETTLAGNRADINRETTRLGQERSAELTRETQRLGAENTRETQAQQEERIRSRPKTVGASELERGRRIDNNAREALLQNPEWEDYIEFNQDGSVRGVKEVGFGTGLPFVGTKELTPAMRQQILSALMKGLDGGSTTSTPTPSTATSGKVRVRNLETGQTGTVSTATLEAYPEKYEKVP